MEQPELVMNFLTVLGAPLIPSTQKRLQMKILGLVFAFSFVMERQINFPRFSFAFAFVKIMLGKHKPQQQATPTKQNQIPEISFAFTFVIQKRENPKSWDSYFLSLVIVSVRMVKSSSGSGSHLRCLESRFVVRNGLNRHCFAAVF